MCVHMVGMAIDVDPSWLASGVPRSEFEGWSASDRAVALARFSDGWMRQRAVDVWLRDLGWR